MNGQEARLQVLGVQFGAVQPLLVGEQQVMSGIRKQADLTVHGGLSNAVYAYPVEHYAFWREHRRPLGLSTDLPYGSLGENLTLSGFYLAVDVPGSLMAGQAFEVIAGPRRSTLSGRAGPF